MKKYFLTLLTFFALFESYEIVAQSFRRVTWTRIFPSELKQLGVNPERFGEAWMDESGVIWGDTHKFFEHYQDNFHFSYTTASSTCKEIGARLPTEQEFERLAEFMKDEDGKFKVQVLPNLKVCFAKDCTPKPHSFWSSTLKETRRLPCGKGLDRDVDYVAVFVPFKNFGTHGYVEPSETMFCRDHNPITTRWESTTDAFRCVVKK